MADQNLEPFRQEVRNFLNRELDEELKMASTLGFGIPRSLGTKWHKALYLQGWIAPAWPVDQGGTGWNRMQQHIFSEECALSGAPMVMPFGIDMVGPVVYTFGTHKQQTEHLPGILNGDTWWCQGYSEPGAG